MADVFPQRDLPGKAENWGRAVEDRIVSGELTHEQLQQQVDNGQRATGGQLSVLAQQVIELTERQTLANVLQETLLIPGNASGDARNFWSPFEFSITKYRGLVLSTDMTASITTVGVGGSLIPVLGLEVIPGLINILNTQTTVRNTLSRTTAGTSMGNIFQRAYIRAAPGTYRIWAGVLYSATGAGSTAEVTHGVSTLVIGQPIPESFSSDL